MTPTDFQQAVLGWFDQHGRSNLPWQQDINAYRVWVSEIMLQQTQVSTVIPYYERFMESYPDVHSLATASLDEVLHHWTGLGYYARARNLYKTANWLVTHTSGEFPTSIEGLCKLPGIGRSTAGAISSIAFKIPATILDGNVKRVLARFSATAGWPGNNTVLQKLWLVAESYTPNIRVADYTQAMMDMGATLCTRSAPSCDACPLNKHCKAFQQGNPKDYPGKKPRKILPIRTQFLLMIHNAQGEVLLQQNPPLGLWGGLWVFPQVDTEIGIAETCSKLGLQIVSQTINPTKRHTFSHFHLDYQSVALKAHINSAMVAENDSHIWYNTAKPLSLGMPAPIKALLDQYYPNQ